MHDCQRGDCGICQVGVIQGTPDHRDYILTDAEKLRQGHANLRFAVEIAAARARSLKKEVFMARYRGNVEAIKGSRPRDRGTPRRLYRREVFQLEMEHVFANTWAYVGHDSQVAKPGDYYGTTIGTSADLDGAPHRQHRQSPA